eukprot:CAMPEP_0168749438 /NCGR_PEP_ID=MMETSP0724-20121128/16716_1 /TAXON_ID=265536 /ORGANISM="Amphiprora sp., Strain CCMP467" /LENGTH=242 /DNA_ID=CAMNT_0008797347 /DNA_START=155 /DNA_END=883 /DNA_ORIENTATION=+
MPHIILETTAAKCFRVDVSQEFVITINYDAPDINSYTQEEEENKNTQRRKDYFRGHDMSISLTQREENKFGWNEKNRRRTKTTGSQKLRQLIDTETGTIDFYTGNTAGVLECCVQSYKATARNTRRLGLNITQRSATAQEQKQNAPLQQDQEKIPDNVQQDSILTVETSHISIELERMEAKLSELAANSGRSKDIEQDFHSKSIYLNQAVKNWPMFRIVIAIVAGVMQAHLVVSYMRARHIY